MCRHTVYKQVQLNVLLNVCAQNIQNFVPNFYQLKMAERELGWIKQTSLCAIKVAQYGDSVYVPVYLCMHELQMLTGNIKYTGIMHQ